MARTIAVLLALSAISDEAALARQAEDGAGVPSAMAGATLGFYSGGVSGLMGSLFPCDRTLLGPRCSTVASLVGGSIGLVSGAVAGSESTDVIRDRARGALYGVVIGGIVGGLLQGAVRQYAWDDALLVAAYGAAVGAAPRGTLIGAGIGAAAGGFLWVMHPQDGFANLVMLTLVGSALGGLADWVEGAFHASSGSGPRIFTSFSIAVR